MDVGLTLATRITPKGIAWVSTWARGRRFLVVGQPRAGKTSLVRYFRYGVLADPDQLTERTRKIEKTAAFTIMMGKNQALQLRVRHVIDTVGQALASEHAINALKLKPHGLAIVLDLSTSWGGPNEYSAGFYLNEFCDCLSEKLHHTSALRRVLRSIVVVLNKKDLVRSDKRSRWKSSCGKLLNEKLVHSFGLKSKAIPVIPCTLLDGKDGGKSADQVMTHIAMSLSHK